MSLFGGFKTTKVKPLLKMAVSRFHIASNKKTAIMKQQMREIAKLLAEEPTPKEEKAKIRAEGTCVARRFGITFLLSSKVRRLQIVRRGLIVLTISCVVIHNRLLWSTQKRRMLRNAQ